MDRSAFSDRGIDRLSELRTRPKELERVRTGASARFLPVWRNKCLVQGDRVALLTREEAGIGAQDPERCTLLGAADGHTIFSFAIEDDEPGFDTDGEFIGLRTVFSRVAEPDSALFAYAKAMTLWQNRHRHCGVCGTLNRLGEAGFVTECAEPGCAHRSFPRLDPAVIVLVTHQDLCLLGRKAEWPAGRFSTIAGFVEPGEGLEDAVRREVREETNVAVGACRYMGSQPWPFPAALMIGFHATANSTGIACNDEELVEARWVSRDQVIAGEIILPPSISIAYRLVEIWFDGYDGAPLGSLDLPEPTNWAPRPVDE